MYISPKAAHFKFQGNGCKATDFLHRVEQDFPDLVHATKFETLWKRLKPAATRVSFFYLTRGQNYGSTETVRSPVRASNLGTFAGPFNGAKTNSW